MPAWYYFTCPTHFAFHDLTTTIKPPPGLHKLLGLGLKFIPTPPHSNTWTDLAETTYASFDRDHQVRTFCIGHMEPKQEIPLKLYALGKEDNLAAAVAMQKDNYNPRMYVRSKWEPPDHMIPSELDRRLKHFKQALQVKFNKKKK